MQARIHSPVYEGALFDHDGNALVDPARLVWGLERACLSLGVKIFENSKVDWLEDVEGGIRVHAPYGAVTAAKVALATNVFPSLVRKARKYVVAGLRLRARDRAAERPTAGEHRLAGSRRRRRLG